MEFKIIDDGKEINCESILIFRDDNNNRNYIVYMEENDDNVYSSRYNIVNGEIVLEAIENEYEWNMIDNMLERSGE